MKIPSLEDFQKITAGVQNPANAAATTPALPSAQDFVSIPTPTYAPATAVPATPEQQSAYLQKQGMTPEQAQTYIKKPANYAESRSLAGKQQTIRTQLWAKAIAEQEAKPWTLGQKAASAVSKVLESVYVPVAGVLAARSMADFAKIDTDMYNIWHNQEKGSVAQVLTDVMSTVSVGYSMYMIGSVINAGANAIQFQTALNKVYTPEWNRWVAGTDQERLLRNWGQAATAIQDNKGGTRGPTGKDWVGNDTFSNRGATALQVDGNLFQKVKDTEGAMWDYFGAGGKGGTPTPIKPNFNDPIQSRLISDWMTARADFYGSFKTVPYTDVVSGAAAGAPAGTSLMVFPTHVPQPTAGQTAALLRIPQGGSLPVTVTGITQVDGQPMATVAELPNPVSIADLILPGDDTPISSPVATISNQETSIARSTPITTSAVSPAAEGMPSGVAEAGTPFHAQSLKPGEIEVYHFSPNLITEVDPRKWGTGPVPGAERNTKMFKDSATGEMKPYPGNLATSDWYLKGTPPDPHLLGYFLYRGVIDGATLLQVDYDNSKVPVPDDVTLKAAGFTGIQYHSTSPWPNQVRLFDITPVTLVGKSQVPPGYDAQHYSAGLAAQNVGPIDPSLLTAKELKTALDQGTLAVVGITVGIPANASKALASQIEAENATRVRTLRNKGYTIMDGAFGAGPEKSIIALPQEAEALARKFGSSIPGVQTIQQSFITMDHGKYLMWSWDKDSDTYMVSMTGSHIAYDNKLEDFFTSTPNKGGEPIKWSIDDFEDVQGQNGGEAGLASQAGTAGLKESSPIETQFPQSRMAAKGTPEYDAIDKAYRKDTGSLATPIGYNVDAWHAATTEAIVASGQQKELNGIIEALLASDEQLAGVKWIGPSKTAGSIYEKVDRSGRSIRNLGDTVRGSFVFPAYNGAQAAAVLQLLKTQYRIEMVRSSLTMPNGVNIYGYRDAKLWVFLPDGKLAEMQFQTEETMAIRSEIASEIYRKYRAVKLTDLTPEERIQYQKDIDTIRGAYNQLFSSMDQKELQGVEDALYTASENTGLNEAAPTVRDMIPGLDEPTPQTLVEMFAAIVVPGSEFDIAAPAPAPLSYREVAQAGLDAREEIIAGHDVVSYKEGVIRSSIDKSAIAKAFFEDGGALFKGMKFETMAEKAEVFRLMRDPRFEHGFTMAIGSSGRILGIQGVSAGLPMYTELFKNRVHIEIPIIVAWTREVEAKNGEKVVRLVFSHNHPSTHTDPSPSDSRMYVSLIKGLSRADRTVEGIIVDHERYTSFTLSQAGDVVAHTEWTATTKDPLITPILSFLVTDTESAAKAAIGVAHNPQQGVLIGTDAWNTATFIAIVDAATYSDKAAMTKFIQMTMYGSGARNAILVLDKNLVSPEEISKAGGLGSLVDDGFLTDVALIETPTDTTSGFTSARAGLEYQPGYHSQDYREDVALAGGKYLGLRYNVQGAMSILDPNERTAAIRQLFDSGVQYNARSSAKKPVSTFIQDEQDVEIAGILADAIATGAVTIDPDGLPVPTNWFPTGLPGKEVLANGTLFTAKDGMLYVPTAKALAKYNGMFGVKVDFMNKLGAKDYMESAMSFCLGKYDIAGAQKAFTNVMNFMDKGAGYVFLFGGNPVSTAASNPYFQDVAGQAQSTVFGEGVQPKAKELASLHRAVADRVVDVKAAQDYAHKIYAVARIDSVGVGSFGLTGHPIYSVRLNLGAVTVFNKPLSMEGVLEAYSKGKGLQETAPSSAVNVQNRAEFNLNRKVSIPVAGAEATKAMVKALNAKPTYRPNNPDYTSETDKLLSEGLFENAGQVPQHMDEGIYYTVGDDGAIQKLTVPGYGNGQWVVSENLTGDTQLSGNAAEYNTDEEERMAALAVKDNIVPPPVADLTNMSAWNTPLADFAGRWNPGWSEVMRQQYRTNERFWFDRVRYALTTGVLDMKTVEFQDAAQDTWMFKKIFDEAYRTMEVMPRQRYYHATAVLSAVLDSGRLKGREEIAVDQAKAYQVKHHIFEADGIKVSFNNPDSIVGLGGGASFTASVSSNIKAARDIAIGLLDAHRIAAGELTIDDMIERAKTGSDALRPYIKDLRMSLLLNRMNGSEDREATDPELLDNVWIDALDDWAKARENAGGPIDPFIMNQDRVDWAALDPNEIGFVEVEVPPDTRGYQTQELSEWRIIAPEVTKITAAHHIDEVIMGPDFTPRVNGKGLSPETQQTIIDAIAKGEWAKGHARTFANGAEFPINNQPFALIKFMVTHAYTVHSDAKPGEGLSLNETGIIGAVVDAIGYNRAAMAEEYQRFDDALRELSEDDQFIGIFKDLVALTSAGERPARNIAAAIQAFDILFKQGQKITPENGGNFYFSKSPTLRQKLNDYRATGAFTGEKMAPYANAQHGDEGAAAIDRNITQAFLGKKVSTPAEKAVIWSLIGKASWYLGMTPREGSAQLWSMVRPTPRNQSLAEILGSNLGMKSDIKGLGLHMEMARLYGSPTGGFFSKRANAVEQARKRSIASDAATRANEPTHIDGVKSATPNEILEIVRGTVESILQDNNFIPRDGVKIIDARIIGSRTRGTPRANSDLDIVLEYDGGIADLREDDFFNMLHAKDAAMVEFDGIKVDINPIKATGTGTIAEYLNRDPSRHPLADVVPSWALQRPVAEKFGLVGGGGSAISNFQSSDVYGPFGTGRIYESGPAYRGHSSQFGHEASTRVAPSYSESRDVAAAYATGSEKNAIVTNVNIDDSKFLTFGTDDGTVSVQDLQTMIKDKALFTKIGDQFAWLTDGEQLALNGARPDSYIDTFDLANNKDFVAWAKKEGYTGLKYRGIFEPDVYALKAGKTTNGEASYPLEWRPFSPDLVTTLGSSTEGIFEDAVAFVPGDSSGLEEEGIPYTASNVEPGAISIGEPSNQAKGVIRATSLHTAESRRLDQLQAKMAKTLKGMETVRVTQQEFMAVIRAANLGAADITTVLNAYKKATNSDKIWPMLDQVYKSASVQAAKEMAIKEKVKTLTAAQKQTAKALGQAKAQIVAKYILEENHRRVQSEFEDFMDRAGVPASMFRTPAQILNLVDSVKGAKSLQNAEDLVAAKIEVTYRSDLTERLKDLKARLQNSKSIDVVYKEKALGLLSDIEFAGHPEKLRAQVQRMLDEVEKQRAAGEDVSLSSKHLRQLDMMSRKPVLNMSTGELIQLIETVEELAGWGSMKQRARVAVYNNEVDALVKELLPGVTAQDEAARRDIEGLNYIETGIGNASKGLNARDAVHRLMLGDKPIWYIADILGVPQLKTRMDAAFDNYLNMRDATRNVLREIAAKNNLGAKQMRRMGAVMHAEDENGAGVLSEWGITPQDAANIKSSFSKGEQEWYAAARQILDGTYPQIDKSLQENFNRRLGFVANYFPRYRAAEDVDNLHISDRFGQLYDPATGKAVTESIDPTRKKNVTMSMTKTRLAKKNKAELNAGRVLERYLDDAAYQIMMTREIRLGKDAVDSAEISSTLGGLGYEVLSEYYGMMARKGGAMGAATMPALDALRQNTGGYQLAWKVASALVQWTQFADVAGLVGPKYAYTGMSDMMNSREWRAFVIRESPKVRNMIGDDPAFLEMGENWWVKGGMFALQNFDRATRVGAFLATYRAYCEAHGLSFNPAEPHAEGIQIAQEMTSRILASPFFEDMPLTLSTGYGIGSKSVARTVLEFQNPMLFRAANINFEVRNLQGLNTTGGAGSVPRGKAGPEPAGAENTPGKKSKAASAWTLFVMLVVAAAIEAGVRRGSKKIMGGTNTDTYMKDVLDQMIGTIPYIGNIYGSLQYGNNPIPAIAMMSDMTKYGSTAYNAYVKGNWKTAMTNTAYFLSMAGGLGGMFPGGSSITQILRYNFLDKAAQDRWAGLLSPAPENPGPPGNP